MTEPVLEQLRLQVDQADNALLEALAARWRAVLAIAEHKRAHALTPTAPDREALLRERWQARAHTLQVPQELVDAVLDQVLSTCRKEVSRQSQTPSE
ncbi:MAG: chorismate mutase [Deltaproteobacteria bacterium]|nr:chorismate mutase [Deltaproteobacteria bacterium]